MNVTTQEVIKMVQKEELNMIYWYDLPQCRKYYAKIYCGTIGLGDFCDSPYDIAVFFSKKDREQFIAQYHMDSTCKETARKISAKNVFIDMEESFVRVEEFYVKGEPTVLILKKGD